MITIPNHGIYRGISNFFNLDFKFIKIGTNVSAYAIGEYNNVLVKTRLVDGSGVHADIEPTCVLSFPNDSILSKAAVTGTGTVDEPQFPAERYLLISTDIESVTVNNVAPVDPEDIQEDEFPLGEMTVVTTSFIYDKFAPKYPSKKTITYKSVNYADWTWTIS